MEQMEQQNKFITPRNIILSVLVIGIIALGFYFSSKRSKPEERRPYVSGYELVSEKVSQSAPIRIFLPKEMDKSAAQNGVKFVPQIEGEWQDSGDAKEIVFKPKEKLALDLYYSVELSTGGSAVLKADFMAVEDPKILAVFPAVGSEAPEKSEITIVFNRPMVPLTTLTELEEKDVPVEISPATEGRFKWITTRNLQFIPKDRLVMSSNYNVKIKSGLVSMDGLSLSESESAFTTRHLRYLETPGGKTVYNQPITLYFNQPVDLERTKKEISLTDVATGQNIEFVAEYGTKAAQEKSKSSRSLLENNKFLANVLSSFSFNIPFFGKDNDEKSQDQDLSIVKIYKKQDRFGRGKLWDFNSNYQLNITKAYPKEGDIDLNESRKINISVPEAIKEISAQSDKTTYASQNFFDPKGKISVEFYEDINLSESKIISSELEDVNYAQKCKNEGDSLDNCEKVENKKKIYLVFNSNGIGLGETFDVNFEKIVNSEGLIVNKETIVKIIHSYPEFKILKSSPSNDSNNAELTKIVLCSNSPIFVPEKTDYGKHFSASPDYELNSWGKSYLVSRASKNELCNPGEFHTVISYGLMPSSDYSLQLNLEDVFSQKLDHSLNFATGEMPSNRLSFYSLQKEYSVTSPEKTRLTFAAENMNYVNLEICELEGADFLYYLQNKLSYYNPPSMISSCQRITKNKILLPERYWINNYFKVDLKDYFEDPIGNYVLTFSHPDYKSTYWSSGKNIVVQAYQRSYVTVTNLAVAEKRIRPENIYYSGIDPSVVDKPKDLSSLYWVTDLATLEPVSGAKIDLYSAIYEHPETGDEGFNLVYSGGTVTDDQGIGKTGVLDQFGGVVITNGKDSTVIPRYDSQLNSAYGSYPAERAYVYTDKPIYRPEQEVNIKGIYRLGYDGNYQIYRDKKIKLTIINSKGIRTEQNLDVNDFGTFETKFILDRNAPLGSYSLCINQRLYDCNYFEVQEYVPAAFSVDVKSDKEEYVSKDNVNLDISGNYYFGVPLSGGEVNYTISSQNYYFDRYDKEYFNFGYQNYWWLSGSYGDKFILRGKASLDENGKAKISQVLDFEKLFSDQAQRKSRIFVVDVTVRNGEGQSVSFQKSFIVHAGDFYLGLSSDKSFFGKNEKINLKVKSVDVQGKEAKAKGITLNLYKVDWIHSKRQEASGGYQYKWEKKREFVKKYDFDTDNSGNFVQQIQIQNEGQYELEASAYDKKNNLVWTVYNVYVYGSGEVEVRPTENTELEIDAEKRNLNVGEKGELIIKSPYQRAKALIAIERGKIFSYEIKDIEGNLYNYSFPIEEGYIPNVFASVLLQSKDPEVKFGSVEFKINTREKELNVEVLAEKKYYLPGEEVVLNVSAKDYQGNPVSAELSLSVVDLSVLALEGNPKKNPIAFFYNGFPLSVSTASNLKNILIETTILTKGGGGGSEEALASKKRGEFKETAFWQARVLTDKDGKAQIKFTLPDNLTTWQAEALAVTKDTRLGVDYQEFMTRKELMAVPLKPRFTVPGDVFYVGAQIFNQSQEKKKVKVTIESQALSLLEDSETEIKIDAGKSETVYFKVKSPDNIKEGSHAFVISAKSDGLQDTVEQSIAVVPNNTYESVATANYTQQSSVNEYVFLPDNIEKDKGNLTIKSSATLAVFLSDALNYLMGFPYGCSEQIASKLNSIAIVKKGLNLPNISDKFDLKKIKYGDREYSIDEAVQISLPKLYNNQNSDGGFSYWGTGESNFYLTLYTVDALNNLSLAGYDVNENNLNKAANYINNKINSDPLLYQNKNTIILTAYTLSGLPGFDKNGNLAKKTKSLAKDDLFLNDQISNNSLSYLAILSTRWFDNSLKTKVFNVLDNRIVIDARGAFLGSNKNVNWWYYETPVKNTALYLKAMVANKKDNQISDKVLRWILNSRDKDGAWGSTNNTISVIDAFTDFLQWKRETESNFSLELLLNEKSKGSFEFNEQTILDQFSKDFQLNELEFNEINTVSFVKKNNNNLPNNLYYDMSLRYYLPIDQTPPRDEGFTIERGFYGLDDIEGKNPLSEAKTGDVIREHLKIIVPVNRKFVAIEDFIPAGMEIVNLDLATEQKSLLLQDKELKEREFRPDFKEFYDERAFLFKENVNPGVYEFDYYVRALTKGKFAQLPAVVSEMYFPENFGRTAGSYFEIK